MPVRLAVVHVDDADCIPAAHQRNRKERFVGILEELGKFLESRIGERVGGQRHHRSMLRHPARDPFAGLHLQHADIVYVGCLRSAQHNLVRSLIDEVNQTSVACRSLHCQSDHFTQFFIQV